MIEPGSRRLEMKYGEPHRSRFIESRDGQTPDPPRWRLDTTEVYLGSSCFNTTRGGLCLTPGAYQDLLITEFSHN